MKTNIKIALFWDFLLLKKLKPLCFSAMGTKPVISEIKMVFIDMLRQYTSFDFHITAKQPMQLLPQSPISAPWGNFFAQQQPFWERLSRGAPRRSAELWSGMHRRTRAHARSNPDAQRHSDSGRHVHRTGPERACGELQRPTPSPWNPTAPGPLSFDVAGPLRALKCSGADIASHRHAHAPLRPPGCCPVL